MAGAVQRLGLGIDAKLKCSYPARGMEHVQKYFKFARYTFQGIGIASLGTLGVTPSWGGFVLGMASLVIAITLVAYEEE